MADCGCLFCTWSAQPDLQYIRLPLVVRTTAVHPDHPDHPDRPALVLVVTGTASRPTAARCADRTFDSLWDACQQLDLPPSSLQIRTSQLGIVSLESLRAVRWLGTGRTPVDGDMAGAWECSGCGEPVSPRLLRSLTGDDVDRYITAGESPPKRRRLLHGGPVEFHPAHTPIALWTPDTLMGWMEREYGEGRVGEVPLVAILDQEPHSFRDDFLCRWRQPGRSATVDMWMRQSFSTLCPDYYRQWQQWQCAAESTDTSWDRFDFN